MTGEVQAPNGESSRLQAPVRLHDGLSGSVATKLKVAVPSVVAAGGCAVMATVGEVVSAVPTLSPTLTVRARVPLAAITVTEDAPEFEPAGVEIVRMLVWPGTILGGENEAVAPDGTS